MSNPRWSPGCWDTPGLVNSAVRCAGKTWAAAGLKDLGAENGLAKGEILELFLRCLCCDVNGQVKLHGQVITDTTFGDYTTFHGQVKCQGERQFAVFQS